MKKTQLKCLKCGTDKLVKNGLIFGTQRYKCKQCGYQFTKSAPAGKPLFIKLISHALYLSGMSMRQIAPVIGVTVQSVSRWIKKWHPTYMNELGEKSKILETKAKDLVNKLQLKPYDDLRVIETKLPSGAYFYTIIRLPNENISSLKE